MLKIILIILSGVLAGFLLKEKSVAKYIGRTINIIIMLLLFSLGISVGAKENVVNNFANIGLDAFLLTLGGLGGTLFCARFVYEKFFKGKDNSE